MKDISIQYLIWSDVVYESKSEGPPQLAEFDFWRDYKVKLTMES